MDEIVVERAYYSSEGIYLLDDLIEIEGYHIRAYSELESFFEEPEPYIDMILTSAAIIPYIETKGSVLLVQCRDSSIPFRIELPSGSVNSDLDENITDTAIREFEEETGLNISKKNIKPFMARYHSEGRGGLQYLGKISSPNLELERIDHMGREWYIPIEGTDNGKTIRIILEPLDLFIDPSLSLLRASTHPWAIDWSFRETLRLVIERGNT